MLRILIFIAALPALASAWELTYSATTLGAPTWNRPEESLTSLSVKGNNTPYHEHTFVAPHSGTYTITSLAALGWDNFIVLYQGNVNPAAPLANAIAANDDYGFVGQSRIIVANLTGGSTYSVVTTGFFNSSFGSFTNTLSAPAPEPATWAFLLTGLGAVLIRSAGRRGRVGGSLKPATRPEVRK